MQMQKGNRAVAEHAKNGKSILLFKIGPQGVKFADDVVCEGYEVRKALGRLGNIRDAFVFHLRPMDNLNERVDAQQVSALDMGALLEMAFSAANPPPKKTTILSQVVERSRAVRDYGVARANGHCEGCSAPFPFVRANGIPYLEPHHIRRLSDGGPNDPRFVIALCPNCHRRVHFGSDDNTYNTSLPAKIKSIEVT
ncbi:5-methylcytosine-specific restriction protein A [Neorhizobium sp. R1-B]|uniref:HNH endonuclease n=1 Tax=Neorhizobium sp. R1-B TaxID=2485162 RepID=UPI0010E89D83|nr:5-methylcytosine-specific restriction protein A [Neorhizobium sp. R1-B]